MPFGCSLAVRCGEVGDVGGGWVRWWCFEAVEWRNWVNYSELRLWMT